MRNSRERLSAERGEHSERDAPARTSGAPENPILAARGLALDGMGNRALLALLRSGQLQRKARVSEPSDPLEHEADCVADQVMRMPAPEVSIAAAPLQVSRKCDACEEDEKVQTLQTKPDGSSEAAASSVPPRIQRFSGQSNGQMDAVPASVNQVLSSPGRPLEPALRRDMEQRFGYDFSRVRVHTDAKAAESARAVRARAYTIGGDIIFAPGEYAPGISDGAKLLAHELAHVVQQGRADAGTPDVQRDNDKKPAPIKWKYHYDKKPQADVWVQRLREKGITVEDPVEEKEGWTFVIVPMSEAEAQAAAEAKAAAEPTHAITVEHEGIPGLRGVSVPYVKDVPKCPDSITTTPPMQVWPACFKTEKEANALKAKFDKAQIKAEVVQVTDTSFGLRFQPMTETEAKAAGEAAAKGRSIGADDVTFAVTTSENKELHSFTFDIQAQCPPDFEDLGSFELTAYWVSQEKDFPDGETESDPSLPGRTFRKGFLTSTKPPFYGVKKEGSGRTLKGEFINFSNSKFTIDPCPRDASGGCLRAGVSVAVAADIPIGTTLLIEGVGTRIAADHGEAVGSHHIDVFFGETLSASEAYKLTFFNRKVCKKKAPTPKTPPPAPKP